VPLVPAAGVPLNTFVVALNVTPLGRVPDSAIVGAGTPVAVTVIDPATSTVNEALLALVIAGAWFTVNVKLWLAVPALLLAVMVIV
jgi:hypothetical protein